MAMVGAGGDDEGDTDNDEEDEDDDKDEKEEEEKEGAGAGAGGDTDILLPPSCEPPLLGVFILIELRASLLSSASSTMAALSSPSSFVIPTISADGGEVSA